MEIQRIRYLQGSAASYFSVRRFVIGSLEYSLAERRKTRINILRRDEWFSTAVETNIRIARGLIYDYGNARNMKKVQTIMFLQSFLPRVFEEVMNFINAMQLVLTFFMRL